MAGITAAQFEKRYGPLARAEYAEYTGREALRTAFASMAASILNAMGLVGTAIH